MVLLASGLVLRRWAPRAGMALVVLALLVLYALSAGPIAGILVQSLETVPPLAPDDPRLSRVQAIVVLGGGRRDWAPEFGDSTVSSATLERIRYGAFLHRRTGIPLAVSGGTVFGDGPPEAVLMARALERDFQVPVRWQESASRNTEQNAARSWRLLSEAGTTRIALISHANHLPRAVPMFQDQGFQVLPAPTAFRSGPPAPRRFLDWLPSAGVFADSRVALHEFLGRLWYRLRRS